MLAIQVSLEMDCNVHEPYCCLHQQRAKQDSMGTVLSVIHANHAHNMLTHNLLVMRGP